MYVYVYIYICSSPVTRVNPQVRFFFWRSALLRPM